MVVHDPGKEIPGHRPVFFLRVYHFDTGEVNLACIKSCRYLKLSIPRKCFPRTSENAFATARSPIGQDLGQLVSSYLTGIWDEHQSAILRSRHSPVQS